MSEDDRDESVCLITAEKIPNTMSLKWQNKEYYKGKGEAKAENTEKEIDIFSEHCFVVFTNITQYHNAI